MPPSRVWEGGSSTKAFSNSWFRDWNKKTNPLTPISGSFNYIKDPDDSSVTIGWEACYNNASDELFFQAPCLYEAEIHANWDCLVTTGTQDRTSSTGKGAQDKAIALDLSCPSPP